MHKQEKKETVQEEVKREFQLERMILFSDAVFAIVITLMAIEIKLPEGEDVVYNWHSMLHHLTPVLLAYAASFFFIGIIWYSHLKLFSLLKSYDKKLVVHNLLVLFCVGLFPFGATVIAHGKGNFDALIVYFFIIIICLITFSLLMRYVLATAEIRTDEDISEQLIDLKRRKVSLIAFGIAFVLIYITNSFIDNPALKSLSMMWMLILPIALKLFGPPKVKVDKKVSA